MTEAIAANGLGVIIKQEDLKDGINKSVANDMKKIEAKNENCALFINCFSNFWMRINARGRGGHTVSS